MTLPDTDDLLLFGSLALAAVGAALVTLSTTDDAGAAMGVALLLFGIPAFLVTFLAASEPEK